MTAGRFGTVADLVDRSRRSTDPAFEGDDISYDYRQFCTTVHKAGNFLSHFGVRPGARVSVIPDRSTGAAAVVALLGAGLLGATVDLGSRESDPVEAVVAPATAFQDGTIRPEPGTVGVSYGGTVEEPSIHPIGRGLWSENPSCPIPPTLAPETPLLKAAEDCVLDHRTLLSEAESVAGEWREDEPVVVAVRAPIDHPGTIVAGLLAPLVVGGTIVRVPEDCRGQARGSIAVSGRPDAPERLVLDPDEVLARLR